MTAPVNPVHKLFYTPQEATGALAMGLDAVEEWMRSGRLKYSVKPGGRKRLIHRDDLEDFARWFQEEHCACPSFETLKARSGSSTSNVVGVDFRDRSTAKTAGRKSAPTDPSARPKGRKRSLELGPMRPAGGHE